MIASTVGGDLPGEPNKVKGDRLLNMIFKRESTLVLDYEEIHLNLTSLYYKPSSDIKENVFPPSGDFHNTCTSDTLS